MVIAEHPLIETIINDLRTELSRSLGADFVGMYVIGSLATGDFQHGVSDIDIVVVTASEINNFQFKSLESIHNSMRAAAHELAESLGVSYLSLETLRSGDFGQMYPAIWRGTAFHLEEAASELVIARNVLRAKALVVCGPLPDSLCELTSGEDLRSVMLKACRSEFRHCSDMIDSYTALSFWVLTVCRALYTVLNETIVSKQLAAEWVIRTWPEWSSLIESALSVRNNATLVSSDWREDSQIVVSRARRFIDFAIQEIESSGSKRFGSS